MSGARPVVLERNGRFWELVIAGEALMLREGKVGGAGRTKTIRYTTPQYAKVAREMMLRKKAGEGWTPAGATTRASTRAEPPPRRRSAPLKPDARTMALLKRLVGVNDRYTRENGGKAQVRTAARAGIAEIATLAKGKRQPLTPMLAARFAFAGRWDGAEIGTWFSAEEIARGPAPKIKARIAKLRKMKHSPLATVPPERCALFATRDDPIDFFFLWRSGEGREPEVLRLYGGGQVFLHRDLRDFLRYLTTAD